ncbi:universal stress protein family protein [Kribbella voronezhensis]|uniref:Universal stress protein family protein n=1 Tax=Kribbella voronezhensis TaxID=2512212 RepID=A0A4R7T8B9_9ACTN|nr:universal stress protein [Kribbella voronezhensis]TDU87909.1 universal stress protein family protein [Kribbella voronezhensis]
MSSWTRTGPVVVEVDGSADGLRVVGYAGEVAVRAGAELVLVAAYHGYSSYSAMVPVYAPQVPADGAEEMLGEAVGFVRRQFGEELKVSTVAREGSRLKVLQRAARDARVVVVAREHASGPAGIVSAQGNLAVAGRAGCPVIVVAPGWRPAAAEYGVVVGIDGTPLSLEAVEFAFRTAADRGRELTVVHSHHVPYRRLVADDGTWQERAALTVSETLAGWDEEYPQVKVTRLLTTRPVVATLARESQHADLVVVGAHTGPLPIGDPVARRTIAEMTCPVAIVAHHVTPAERDRRRREIPAPSDIIATTY